MVGALGFAHCNSGDDMTKRIGPLSKKDQERIKSGVETFVAAVSKTHRGRISLEGLEGAVSRGNIESFSIIASVTESRFAGECEKLAFSAGEEGPRGKGLWQCVLTALRRRLCGNDAAKKRVNDAIKRAKLAEPTATGLSVGAGTIVAISIGSLFGGSIAVAAAPVLGGLAYLLIASGVDGICEWGGEPTPPEEQKGSNSKPKPTKKNRRKTSSGKKS